MLTLLKAGVEALKLRYLVAKLGPPYDEPSSKPPRAVKYGLEWDSESARWVAEGSEATDSDDSEGEPVEEEAIEEPEAGQLILPGRDSLVLPAFEGGQDAPWDLSPIEAVRSGLDLDEYMMLKETFLPEVHDVAADNPTRKSWSDIVADPANVLNDYTTPAYRIINGKLRDGIVTPEAMAISSQMRTTSESRVVYRGIEETLEALSEKTEAEWRVGSVILEKGFMSTTRSPKMAWDWLENEDSEVFLELTVGRGIQGLNLTDPDGVGTHPIVGTELLVNYGQAFLLTDMQAADTPRGRRYFFKGETIGPQM